LVYFSVLHDGCLLIDLLLLPHLLHLFPVFPSGAMADLPPLRGSSSAAYARLSEHERAIIQNQVDAPTVNATFLRLFQYATTTDLIIIFISALCAIIGGAALPIPTVMRYARLG
jgi:hypothetical protein